jgi:DEAD/DEAH box helicase domain-containing protein
MVASRATIYKKLKFVTNENLGWGKIHLPELELQTTAYWATLDRAAAGWRRAELDVALAGTGRALQAVASVLLMTDPRDLGLVAQVRSPHAEAPTIYLYEAVPGGVGLAERLWARHAELVAGATDLVAACPCQGGCPSCTGPRPPSGDGGLDAKVLVLRLLAALGQDARPDAQREAASGRTGPRGRPAVGPGVPAAGAMPAGLVVTR